MSRPGKRRRGEVDCGGFGCEYSECVSCSDVPEVAATASFGQPQHVRLTHGPPEYLASQYGRPPPPATHEPPPNAGHPVPSYEYMMSQLDDNTVRLILSRLAVTSPPAQSAITFSYQQQMRMMRERVIDFSDYSAQAWHLLNTSEYTRGSGSRQFEASFAARSDLIECIMAIGMGTSPECPYETKLSALETLREIAETVLLAGDTLGSEVRKEFQHETCLAHIMVALVITMTPEEQRRAGAHSDAKGTLATKIRWVCDQAQAHCLEGFSRLRDVLPLFAGAPDNANEPRPPLRGHGVV
ncbi:hypothetical protein F5Y12DRAFT_715383 [Xylaria sp. FL1777]|nr:hypothetical protein F5Y12DRAFT_715383 [Xylaria sp. FL1777]